MTTRDGGTRDPRLQRLPAEGKRAGMASPLPRSHSVRVLPRVGLWTAFGVALVLACAGDDTKSRPRSDTTPAWSVQLHAHGSFSEGIGSVDSHSYEAEALGVDAIWWSDHDFRITSYRHVNHFGFEGPSEPIDADETWSVELRRHAGDRKTIDLAADLSGSSATFVPDAIEGEQCLRLRTQNDGAEFRAYPCVLSASRMLHRRPTAGDVSIRAAVRPRAVGEDAVVFVRFLVSEHAPREGLPMAQYSVRYELGVGGDPYRDGTTYHVPIACEAGAWNRLKFSLSDDLAEGFPFVPARDNALYRIIVGVEARNGATAEADFDELVIEHVKRGRKMFDVQRDVLDEVGELYPDVRQLQGVEVSFASRHLNEFSVDTELLDYDGLVANAERESDDERWLVESAFRRDVTEAAVAGAHDRGGLISFNHMFGTALEDGDAVRDRAEQVQRLTRNRAFGVDILEVGYRDRGGASLDDHLWVWDQLALAGVRLVGTGVSDTHGGPDERWTGRPNNFVSWIYADKLAKAELIDGMARGRVYFGDIELWDGTLDIETERGFVMGQELVTDRDAIDFEAVVTGHVTGDRLVVIAGGERVHEETIASGAGGVSARVDLTAMRPGDVGTFLRVVLEDRAGAPKALSNPIWILRPEQASHLRTERVAIDVAGVRSTAIEGFRVAAIERFEEDGRTCLRVRGQGPDASLTFRTDSDANVRVNGISGETSVEDRVIRIRKTKGAGYIEILP